MDKVSQMANWQFSEKTVADFFLIFEGPFVGPLCHLAVRPTFPNCLNGNLVTVLSLNYHSAVQTQTQMQTETEAYRMHSPMSHMG